MVPGDDEELERIVLARGLDPAALADARKMVERTRCTLASALIAFGPLTEADVTEALAARFGLPPWDGGIDVVATRELDKLMSSLGAVVVSRDGRRVVVASTEPLGPNDEDALRFALRVSEIANVIGEGRALSRARARATGLVERVVAELSEVRLPSGPRWESELRARWRDGTLGEDDVVEDQPEIRLANLLLLAMLDRAYEAIRVDVGREAAIRGRVAGLWISLPELEGLTDVPAVAAALAARYGMMADAEEGHATLGWGWIRLLVGKRPDGAERQNALDCFGMRTAGGSVVVAAVTRCREEATPEVRERSAAAIRAAGEAIAARRFEEATHQLDSLADVLAAQPRGSYFEAMLLRIRADAAFAAGDVARAVDLRRRSLACTDDVVLLRIQALVDLGSELADLDAYDEALAHLARACVEADDWFGPTSSTAFIARSTLAFVQIDAGALRDAAATTAALVALCAGLGKDIELSMTHLEARLALATGDAASAAKTLDVARLESVAASNPRLYAAILHDAGRAHALLGDLRGARARLEEAAAALRGHLVSTHREVRDIDRALEEVRPKQPYR